MTQTDLQQETEIMDSTHHTERCLVRVKPEHCARNRHRLSTCARCMDLCPVGAITWDNGLKIDRAKCNACGTCAAVCPTAALEVESPSNLELLDQIAKAVERDSSLTFACPRTQQMSVDSHNMITISCLGRLDESLLIGAIAHGAESVRLLDNGCAGCPQASGRQVAQVSVGRSNALLKAFGIPPRITIEPEPPDALRQPFTGDNQKIPNIAAPGHKAEPVPEQEEAQRTGRLFRGEMPTAIPTQRELLLDMLKRLDRPVQFALEESAAECFGRVSVTEDCTACQMCAFFCPAGALTKVGKDGQVGVMFNPSRCLKCGLCRDHCYTNAIVLEAESDLEQVLQGTERLLIMGEEQTEKWSGVFEL